MLKIEILKNDVFLPVESSSLAADSPSRLESFRYWKVRSICSGWNHSLAWVGDDDRSEVWAWGRNAHGQCGDGTTFGCERPQRWGKPFPASERVAMARTEEDQAETEALDSALRSGIQVQKV